MNVQSLIKKIHEVQDLGTLSMKVEAYVDMHNGIDNFCPIVQAMYDPEKHAIILYVDGKDLEY